MIHSTGTFIKRLVLLAAVVVLVSGYLAAGFVPRVPRIATSESVPAATTRDDSLPAAIASLSAAMAASWDAAGVEVAPPADWLIVCRRLSLALVGSGMSLEEIGRLQAISPEQRIDQHLHNLLVDPRHHDYWAERSTRTLCRRRRRPVHHLSAAPISLLAKRLIGRQPEDR